jgi:hypothetical protein
MAAAITKWGIGDTNAQMRELLWQQEIGGKKPRSVNLGGRWSSARVQDIPLHKTGQRILHRGIFAYEVHGHI